MQVEARLAADLSSKDFKAWVHDGPAKGLKRQQCMSRTAVGWIPSKIDAVQVHEDQDPDGTDGLSSEELNSVQVEAPLRQPLALQQSVEQELSKWSAEWAVGLLRTEPN